MWWGGLMILLFVVFHILHLTTGTLHSSFVEGKVYQNVHRAFENPLLVLIYMVAMTAVSSHLYHGVWSLFQTLGLDNADRNECLRKGAKVIAFGVAIGFLLVPLAVLFGGLPAPK
jgi:succinate dehydrogenase / fumarate reductase cytochrome b subunit